MQRKQQQTSKNDLDYGTHTKKNKIIIINKGINKIKIELH